jgi:hypothetical protein
VPAIICWQIGAVDLVIGRDDHATDVEDRVLTQVLLVDPEDVGRRRGVSLHVVVKREAVEIPDVTRVADPQDHGFDEAVKAAEQLLRRHLGEIPVTDNELRRLENSVLSDQLGTAHDERVVDLLPRSLRSLSSVCEPCDQMLGIIGIDAVKMLEPWPCLQRIARQARSCAACQAC